MGGGPEKISLEAYYYKFTHHLVFLPPKKRSIVSIITQFQNLQGFKKTLNKRTILGGLMALSLFLHIFNCFENCCQEQPFIALICYMNSILGLFLKLVIARLKYFLSDFKIIENLLRLSTDLKNFIIFFMIIVYPSFFHAQDGLIR